MEYETLNEKKAPKAATPCFLCTKDVVFATFLSSFGVVNLHARAFTTHTS